MKNTVKELNQRAKKSILILVENCLEEGKDKKETIKAICARLIKLGLVENDGNYNAMLAVAIAFYEIEKAKKEGKKPVECIPQYAHFKHLTSIKLNDFGAFADLLEVLTRVGTRESNFGGYAVQWNDLHVKHQYSTDVTIKGVKFEIGSNGKTFSESTRENPMNGNFEKIAYGVFTDEIKELIFSLAEQNNLEKALEEVYKRLYVFDKETFFHCMTEKVGRGAMYQYKQIYGYWQVIYNYSKHGAFLNMVKNESIPNLKTYLNK